MYNNLHPTTPSSVNYNPGYVPGAGPGPGMDSAGSCAPSDFPAGALCMVPGLAPLSKGGFASDPTDAAFSPRSLPRCWLIGFGSRKASGSQGLSPGVFKPHHSPSPSRSHQMFKVRTLQTNPGALNKSHGLHGQAAVHTGEMPQAVETTAWGQGDQCLPRGL